MFIFLSRGYYTNHKKNISKDERDFAYKVNFLVLMFTHPQKSHEVYTYKQHVFSLFPHTHAHTQTCMGELNT